MPIPVEYNIISHAVPKQEINIDLYDFDMCVPQSDIKDTLESQELEATFCRDFDCCGLILNDLHDLLQHYEEYHVCLEEDDESLFEYESGNQWSPNFSFSSTSSIIDFTPNSPGSDGDVSPYVYEELKLKNKVATHLPDAYNDSYYIPVKSPSPAEESSVDRGNNISKKIKQKKRNYNQYFGSTPNALDLLAQSAVKKLALVNVSSGNHDPTLADEEFLAQTAALLATMSTNSSGDKPFKCLTIGCDKAYKNPNGLKYHNQRGQCNVLNDTNENMISKPHHCSIGDCGKRYKNLNGLKYHIEHYHMLALNQTLYHFGSTLFNPATSNIVSSDTTMISCIEQNIEPLTLWKI